MKGLLTKLRRKFFPYDTFTVRVLTVLQDSPGQALTATEIYQHLLEQYRKDYTISKVWGVLPNLEASEYITTVSHEGRLVYLLVDEGRRILSEIKEDEIDG